METLKVGAKSNPNSVKIFVISVLPTPFIFALPNELTKVFLLCEKAAFTMLNISFSFSISSLLISSLTTAESTSGAGKKLLAGTSNKYVGIVDKLEQL